MNSLKLLNKIILEKTRYDKEKIPFEENMFEILKEWKKKENIFHYIFIHFTNSFKGPKLGINPNKNWDYMSPKGIYCYPLEYVLNELNYIKDSALNHLAGYDKKNWKHDSPFGFDFDYYYIITIKDDTGLIDMGEYTVNDLLIDKNKLMKMFKKQINSNDEIAAFFEEDEGWTVDMDIPPFRILYQNIGELYSFLVDEKLRKEGSKGAFWNKVLRDLGYSILIDESSSGAAHADIAYEVIILDPTIIEKQTNFGDSNRLNTSGYYKNNFEDIIRNELRDAPDQLPDEPDEEEDEEDEN